MTFIIIKFSRIAMMINVINLFYSFQLVFKIVLETTFASYLSFFCVDL